MRKFIYKAIICCLLLPAVCFRVHGNEFEWRFSLENGRGVVSVEIPAKHYLYENMTKVEVFDGSGKTISPEKLPVSKLYHDKALDESYRIYDGPGIFKWIFPILDNDDYNVKLNYQGCRKEPFVCFSPETETLTLNDKDLEKEEAAPVVAVHNEIYDILKRFDVVSRGSGYMSPVKFLDFINNKDGAMERNFLLGKSFIVIILIILTGGLALNLTPCILPMIPINLAIIGAGSEASSKFKGFCRGTAYGLGMALAYGVVGVAAVLTGAKFGTLNSSVFFNFSVAVIFVVLGLSMFDFFEIDFSRLGNGKFGFITSHKGRLFTAFLLGIMAALLAGACVAPVVIAVLLHSAWIYADGNFFGLFLPLFLGIGMALPWPFAGAGFAVLPTPGRWMLVIKKALGFFILMAAFYYAYTGYTLIPSEKNTWLPENEFSGLKRGLLEAERDNKLVFIDFWASWCKNCVQMEAVTFKNPEVRDALREYVKIKFQAEQPSEPSINKIMDYFEIHGLPSYIILKSVKRRN